MPDDTARRNASVPKDTDLTVRIEDAVKWRVLERTMAEARDSFADLAPEALDGLIEEAVASVRPTKACT